MACLHPARAPRLLFGAALAVTLGSYTRAASAGEYLTFGVAGATPDGKYVAAFSYGDTSPGRSCGLYAAGAPQPKGPDIQKPPLVSAYCAPPSGKFLPLAKWRWAKQSALVRELVPFADPFDDKRGEARARIVLDPDTRLQRLEIRDGTRFHPVLTLPGSYPVVTGTLELGDRYLIRVRRSDVLFDWDEVSSFSVAEVPNVARRWLLGRQAAQQSTRALRAEQRAGSAVFSPPPEGKQRRASWEARRRARIEPVLLEWEIAAAQGPLTGEDLVDAVWLLGLLDTAPHRLQALRWLAGLRERDAPRAAAVLAELEAQPDTADFFPYLRTAADPLRGLPDPSWQTLTDEMLRDLSDEAILWLHRQLRALAQFRFSDPSIEAYFSHFVWYEPMPVSRFRPFLTKRAFVKDPDGYLIGRRNESLKALQRAEAARGLAPPEL